MVLTQLEVPYAGLMPCISNYVYEKIRNWALTWQLQNHINNGPSKGLCDLDGLKWHTLPMETYHLQMSIWINSSTISTIRDIAKISLNIERQRHMCDFRHRRVDFCDMCELSVGSDLVFFRLLLSSAFPVADLPCNVNNNHASSSQSRFSLGPRDILQS